MTVGGAVAVVFLAVMVVLILRGIRGHRKSGESDEEPDINAAVEPKSTLAIELAKHKRVEKPCGAEQS